MSTAKKTTKKTAAKEKKALKPVKKTGQHLITKEGLQKLHSELEELKNVRRKEVAARLKEAISYGDLKENSEYQSAREEEFLVETRISEIEALISSAEVVTKKHKKGTGIELGSTVTVENQNDDSETFTFTIVGTTEVDPLHNKLSNESPLGEACIGREEGDIVTFNAPRGEETYKILKAA